MKKWLLIPVLVLCMSVLVVGAGCAQSEQPGGSSTVQATATVELKGNETTGYTWINTIIPEGIVKELSKEYNQDDAAPGTTGVGGTYVFTFEAISEGEAEIMFSYLREFEDNPAVDTAVYKATVDAEGNLKLDLIQAPAGLEAEQVNTTALPPLQPTATVELRGNETTGFSWISVIIPDGIVVELSKEYIEDEVEQGTKGAGGTYVFTFEAIAEGEAEITFHYQQSGDGGPSADVAVYMATVDADGNLKLECIQGPSGVEE